MIVTTCRYVMVCDSDKCSAKTDSQSSITELYDVAEASGWVRRTSGLLAADVLCPTCAKRQLTESQRGDHR